MAAITEQKARTVSEVLSGSQLHRVVLIRKNGLAQAYRAKDIAKALLSKSVEYDAFYNCWVARLDKGPFQQIMVFEPVSE